VLTIVSPWVRESKLGAIIAGGVGQAHRMRLRRRAWHDRCDVPAEAAPFEIEADGDEVGELCLVIVMFVRRERPCPLLRTTRV